MQQLINKIKENNEDFEFYPTSEKIMQIIADDIKKNKKGMYKSDNTYNILDIGCGTGSALNLLKKCIGDQEDGHGNWKNDAIFFNNYGIEKSQTLINNSEDIFVVGRDFMDNTLIDADMDIIFSNPPYSIYSEWVEKIIIECSCETLYLVIPQRWKTNENILKVLRKRTGYELDKEYGKNRFDTCPLEIINTFDFMDSEFRKARAVVDIIRISFNKKETAFDLWFNTNFKIKADKSPEYLSPKGKGKESISDSLVVGQNLIERLVELYDKDMSKLLSNYKSLESIDSVLMDELGVKLDSVKESLHSKIKSLKQKYWTELFNNLDKISDRLTSKYRKIVLDKLNNNLAIDLTTDNMYMIVLWTIKNANIYQDEQLKDMYYEMTYPKNVKNYKSNKHFVKDTWRYRYRDEVKKYTLEYRLVFEDRAVTSFYSYSDRRGISDSAITYMNDIFTIAKTLGFKLTNSGMLTRHWETGKQESFYDDNDVLFAEIRCYKNGNIHAKFNQDFIMKLNIEAGKLNGWVKSAKDYSDETGIDIATVIDHFDSHMKLEMNSLKMLT